MREWFITGADLCGIIVKAESFDEALGAVIDILRGVNNDDFCD